MCVCLLSDKLFEHKTKEIDARVKPLNTNVNTVTTMYQSFPRVQN